MGCGMSFVSWKYLVLLAFVYVGYWMLPQRGRVRLVLLASYFFYGWWDPRFLSLIMASTVVDYFCGSGAHGVRVSPRRAFLTACIPLAWLGSAKLTDLGFGEVPDASLWVAGVFPVVFALIVIALNGGDEDRVRKRFIWISVSANLLILGVFKYFGFFGESFRNLAGAMGMETGWVFPEVVLPVGISFYTFQSLSYTIDIHRGHTNPVKSLTVFATYVAFFPQLVAGPIERAGRLLPQFLERLSWKAEQLQTGLILIVTGYFKKVYVGDNCGLIANHAFQPGGELNGWWAVLGVLAFAFQIYGDFGGYSDIARGSARLLGIELTQNFRFPYLANSPSDFWRRWHVSLSSWFRDYVYIPLGGNRAGRTSRNLLVTMVIAGFWHGAGWMFLLWGFYHGVILAFWREERTSGLHSGMKICVMFLLTLFGWATFRCADVAQFVDWLTGFLFWSESGIGNPLHAGLWLLLHVTPLVLIQCFTLRNRDEGDLSMLAPWQQGLWLFLMFVLISSTTDLQPTFIYFQF